jgi:tryptophan halogenase
MAAIQRVLIVGGGAAGWLTAAYLASALSRPPGRGIEISLVESPEIGILGVGEGTFPSIRGTLSAIGVSEAAFMQGANATFKQGVRFADWVRPKGTAGRAAYFHPFNAPSARPGGPELLPYWLQGDAGLDRPLAHAVTLQATVAEALRAPKRDQDGDWQGPMNYAYHFDATRFAGFLREEAQRRGVRHLQATVERVELDETGAVAQVHTRELGALSADLYIDCTGFRSALIGEALGAPFRDVSDVLFADRAVAIQVPYPREDTPVAPYTLSTAHAAGWTWDIGLTERRGVGYVYSSRHTDDAEAESVLRGYIGPDAEALSARQLRFRLGFRERQWIRNCVAVGLSGGFLDPLESSGIGLIEAAVYLIAHLFPFDGETEAVSRLFNRQMTARYSRIVDFLKLHYCLSRRPEPFWRDNADPGTIPDSLRDQLAMWRARPPHRLDFVTDLEMYPPSSWQFVLYGMEFATDPAGVAAAYRDHVAARREFDTLAQVARHALVDLPDHRAMVRRLHGARAAA